MLRQSRLTLLLWLLAVALLPVRLANAHLHLCFDGQEPPVSVHIQDIPTHHGVDAADGHNDRDLDVAASFLTGKIDNLDKLPAAIVDAHVPSLVLPAQSHGVPRTDFQTPDLVSSFELRPPPRGPPC